jgi:hypothetical protein
LLKNGSINCGWDASDHKDFLRIRTKHNGRTGTVGFMQELIRAVPSIDDDSIRDHVTAYEVYLDLTEKKKYLLQ